MRSVSDIVQRGGTKLRTARCLEMLTKEGQKRAVKTLEARGIDGLVIEVENNLRNDDYFGAACNARIERNIAATSAHYFTVW